MLAASAPGDTLSLLSTPRGLRELARLLGASPFLWEDFLRREAEHLLPVLDSWRKRPLRGRDELAQDLAARLAGAGSFEETRRVLNAFKDEQMLLADMRHLLDPRVDLVAFSAAITDLAEVVVESALRACLDQVARTHGWPRDESGRVPPVAVLGLGKFGGREMGYASDIELVVVYGFAGRTEQTGVDAGVFFEAVVREITGLIAAREEGIFHVDLRLRPHGAKGPLATPLAVLREYYRPAGGAASFERQALIKLRRVAGDEALGAEVERARDAFVWSDEPWDRADALHLRERQCRELVPPGRFNVKYSPGALVEVEYAVQYLQIEHGRRHPELRTPRRSRAWTACRPRARSIPRARRAAGGLPVLAARRGRAPHGPGQRARPAAARERLRGGALSRAAPRLRGAGLGRRRGRAPRRRSAPPRGGLAVLQGALRLVSSRPRTRSKTPRTASVWRRRSLLKRDTGSPRPRL